MSNKPNRYDIVRWESIGDYRVPVDQFGHYLNWETVDDECMTAEPLTDPYHDMHWAIGNSESDEQDGDVTFFFDFAELPDGRIILHSVFNTESGHDIHDADYRVVERDCAVSVAQEMTDNAVTSVAENGLEHDAEGWDQSTCFFWRSVHCHVTKTGSAIRFPVEMEWRPINTRNYF